WLPAASSSHLRMDTQAFNGPRTLTVRVNGEPVLTTAVGDRQTITTPPLTLRRGHNTIALDLAEGCQRPTDLDPASGDGRCLGLLVYSLALTP
ncbi:MAG TPA: hypothetical protein DEP84_27840, partial [Chloroflexi bacterium]|nr:hypothetical protein [Chloroflexota bacterium]